MERDKLISTFNSLRSFREKICGAALILGILVYIFAFMIGNIAVSKGFLLGTCFSVINFILLSIFSPFSLVESRRKATFVSFGSIFIRYFILAIPIIIAIKSEQFELVATIVGIFSIQIVLFSYYVILKPLRKAFL